MKKIISLVLFAAFVAAIGVGTNSCSPTAPNQTDTTRLVSSPSSISLTWFSTSKLDSSSSASVSLTCGCPYAYSIISYGGDTSVIHFNVSDFADTISTHTVSATIYPSSLPVGPDTVAASVILMTWDDKTQSNPGTELFDTIRATAIY
jgi:hypothetical protein